MTVRMVIVQLPRDVLEEPFNTYQNILEAEQWLKQYLRERRLDYSRISQGRFYKINEKEVVTYKFMINAPNATLLEMWRDGYLDNPRTFDPR